MPRRSCQTLAERPLLGHSMKFRNILGASTLGVGVSYSPAACGDNGAGIATVLLFLLAVTGALPATLLGIALAIRPMMGMARAAILLLPQL